LVFHSSTINSTSCWASRGSNEHVSS